jgi:hypothetical protein
MVTGLEHAPFTAQPIDHGKDMQPPQNGELVAREKFHHRN